ncbi:PAS domain-containing sensor histidine kinase [Nitrobacter winogradskyi]|uniref:Cell cycle sensor histidine kinase DivJ n=2 Tax=Nitrobacter winogradskyi TaxID=913 RepID=A0ACC6AE91_NITWI|nr:PAS domain-containing protein [Nitrobacter winogradskyi]MCP1997739.1 cell cycle sensor histidine kinase DivJ [Nitrobacter winogradskyi]GEC14744.1 PAS domain-containing sensor histidine kinase [Nitrobacter winogradskyi]
MSIIKDRLDALLHPSARYDALTRARHRTFMAPRLLGSLAALAAFPMYLAIRGAPSALEVTAFAWLVVPILLSYFLSRTGRYESAHMLSSIALAGLVMMIAIPTGGIGSFAAVWLVVIPLEAALSASRRVVAFASMLAGTCLLALIAMSYLDVLPPDAGAAAHGVFMAFGIASAMIYAAGVAFGSEALMRTSASLLNVEEDRYRLLARHMCDVISRHRRNGAVQFISPAAESLLGVPVSELQGHGLFDRVHVADRPAYLTTLAAAALGKGAQSVEFRLRREAASDANFEAHASGNFIWVEMRCQPLEPSSPAEPEVVAVMRDVTDRKQQEHALDLARTAAERADAAKTRFLATMSHELRTPLNAIIGFSEMIVQEATLPLDATRRKEYAQLINDSGQHLLSVVNSILDMSKMESGSFEILPEPFAPREVLLSGSNLLALKARDNGIELVTRVPENLPQMVGDPRAFRQIVLNLVSNAIKFTERGGRVTISARVEAARMVLRVMDNGVGIAQEDLKRIGDPFFQAGKTYQRRHEGTGLGLSIVKSLVALHRGEIDVQSKVEEGTTVTVMLPLTLVPVAEPLSNNIATLTPASRSGKQDQGYRVRKSA